MKNLLIIVILIASISYCYGQSNPAFRIERVKIHSENHSVFSENVNIAENIDTTVFTYSIKYTEAVWLRVIFSKYYLGDNSYLVIKSLKDGSTQIHNQKSLINWRNRSAVFNGNEVEVKLIVKGNSKDVFFSIDKIIIGETKTPTNETKSLCDGDDNRESENDDRIGRVTRFGLEDNLGWGTAWLSSNGGILTAAHVVDWDPWGYGDGETELIEDDFIEFDVPASDSNGIINFAAAEDQYPIDINNITFPDGYNEGSDWAILRCLPNSNTGLFPQQAQGSFFRMTRESPEIDDIIRITGYGLDETPKGKLPVIIQGHWYNDDSGTLQTADGEYIREDSISNRFWHTYFVDTESGNSGSPVIWDENDFTIGIHSRPGCVPPGEGNIGTSFEHDPLENALHNFHGENTIYVDYISLSPNENGTIFEPYNTIQEGLNATASGGNLYITTGTYSSNNGLYINKEITIIPPATGNIIINP